MNPRHTAAQVSKVPQPVASNVGVMSICLGLWINGVWQKGNRKRQRKKTVQITADGKYATVSGRPFEIQRYKYMIDNAINREERTLSRELLFRDTHVIDGINPYEIYYDERNPFITIILIQRFMEGIIILPMALRVSKVMHEKLF